jgi:hypothetical protein
MCSFNIEALALELVTETAPIAPALADFLLASAQEIAMSHTDDPARVSRPIKLPDGITQAIASRRLEELGQIIAASLGADSEGDARRILSAAFGPQIDNTATANAGASAMRSTSTTARRSRRCLAALARTSPGARSVPESRAWFDDLASLYAFERDARRELGALRRSDASRPRRLVYELRNDT